MGTAYVPSARKKTFSIVNPFRSRGEAG